MKAFVQANPDILVLAFEDEAERDAHAANLMSMAPGCLYYATGAEGVTERRLRKTLRAVKLFVESEKKNRAKALELPARVR